MVYMQVGGNRYTCTGDTCRWVVIGIHVQEVHVVYMQVGGNRYTEGRKEGGGRDGGKGKKSEGEMHSK